jgi:hypothetical protein
MKDFESLKDMVAEIAETIRVATNAETPIPGVCYRLTVELAYDDYGKTIGNLYTLRLDKVE